MVFCVDSTLTNLVMMVLLINLLPKSCFRRTERVNQVPSIYQGHCCRSLTLGTWVAALTRSYEVQGKWNCWQHVSIPELAMGKNA